jgi:hypothetical protein
MSGTRPPTPGQPTTEGENQRRLQCRLAAIETKKGVGKQAEAVVEVIKMQAYLTVTSSKATLAFLTFILAGAMRSASAFVIPGAGLGRAFRSARGAATGLVRMQATEEMGL